MQKIGIGYEDYKRIIDDGCYYVDKTLLIRDVIDKGGMVTLFTRPRRFGKTLALSMIQTFFELEYGYNGEIIDKSPYFTDKKVMDNVDNLWNFLFFTGYMKRVSERSQDDVIYVTMTIPNREVKYVYKTQISQWFERNVKNADFSILYKAIVQKDNAGLCP